MLLDEPSKAGVSKAAKGAANEGDVPHAGKGTMTDAQFDKKQSSTQQTNGNLKASKGTASQSGMFRQLTGRP